MVKNNFIDFLLNLKNRCLPLLHIYKVSIGSVTKIGVHTKAIPIPNCISQKGDNIISSENIL